MKHFTGMIILFVMVFLAASCGNNEKVEEPETQMNAETKKLQERIDIFAPTKISADLSKLTENQKKCITTLVEAGKICDEIFWHQTSPSAKPLYDSLKNLNTPESDVALKFVSINYGPYDRIMEGKRMLGDGPEERPEGGNFYPVDMTKDEFEKFIEENPDKKDDFVSQYTVIKRDEEGSLIAVPYHQAYPEQMKVADKLEEAAEFADNPTLKNYLMARAEALRTDDYFQSDMLWMDISDNDIDVVIGPIENYEDGLYNYKTAYEAVVVVRDLDATKQLQMFRDHVNKFEKMLPTDKKYIRESVGGGKHILNIVNVVYMGGDCQAGVKTIACNLPNDPEVRKVKGGKNTMYKNMMEAKFEKIVVPIAEKILVPDMAKLADKAAFTGFVTLHEVSHSLGRDYVYGKDDLSVRKALKERYSAIEECKADILSMYNHKHLIDEGIYTAEYGKKAMATYLAGLYRSIRFGTEEAHGKANLIQLNFLRESGAIERTENGKFNINEEIFFEKVGELAKLVLTVEAEGDYDRAGEVLDKYGKMTDEIKETIESLKGIPRDLDTSFEI